VPADALRGVRATRFMEASLRGFEAVAAGAELPFFACRVKLGRDGVEPRRRW
jgi:hypothetical protein